MSRIDPQMGLMPSVIDRLIDPESGGTAWRRGYGIEQMMEAVRRDLEDLLNTRQTSVGLPDHFVELRRSIFNYGLPDLVTLDTTTPQARADIGGVIEAVVSIFEPRLKDIRATMIDAGEKTRSVRFHIDARLRVDPAPEVAFDTILELTTGHASVAPST
jgi:type VI secretion system protein ImpF